MVARQNGLITIGRGDNYPQKSNLHFLCVSDRSRRILSSRPFFKTYGFLVFKNCF